VIKLRIDCVIIQIVMIEDKPISEYFEGIIRKQDIRSFEIDKIKVDQQFKVGDFIKTKLVAFLLLTPDFVWRF